MSRVVLVFVLVVAACDATPAPSADGSSSSGGGSSTSGGGVCEVPQSDAAQPVVIRVRNDADATRWFVRPSCMFPLELDGPDAESLRQRAWGWCTACDDVVADDCEPWCEEFCDAVTVGIAPGALFETTWHGRLLETITLACESCDATCDVATAAAPGTYRTAVQVFGECEAIPPDTCDCAPDERGICEIWSPATLLGDGFELARDFDFPTASPIELVITN